MTLTSLIRRTIVQWALWRQHRETRRAMPALRELDRLEALYRRQHRRGSAKIVRAKRDVMTAALAGKRVR
ncbi:hypothetical protein [Mesorhizobium sp.]|uniref:hypothetical protein n=1 Tax=Mesorhizobium sp. TaxID=1871066 RepID=UPI00120DA1C3|nr:hypothetical protein [Mesorhizobium sp.]TIN80748.1 MAG: hypothetical protein E5Y09_02690 [Mesorhizobium sp.]